MKRNYLLIVCEKTWSYISLFDKKIILLTPIEIVFALWDTLTIQIKNNERPLQQPGHYF